MLMLHAFDDMPATQTAFGHLKAAGSITVFGQQRNSASGCTAASNFCNFSSAPSHIACLLQALLECCDARGCTPLHLAAQQGNLATVTFLVYHGANAMTRDHAGATPLHYAAVCPIPWARSPVMRKLLEQGKSASQVDVDATDGSGLTALHWSAGMCLTSADLEGLTYLVGNAQAGVNAADRLGNTPLHHAAASSTVPQVLSTLVQHGAQIDALNVYGDTVVHTAAGFGNPSTDMLHALVTSLGSVVSLPLAEVNGAGQTALQLATIVGWSVSAVKALQLLETEHHQWHTCTGLLDLMVSSGWRLETSEHLLLQALKGESEVQGIWQALCLLRQKWKDDNKTASEKGHFIPLLEMRFRQFVTPSNRRLRQRLIARLFVAAGLNDGCNPPFSWNPISMIKRFLFRF